LTHTAPTPADAGIVSTQAQTMLLARPQRIPRILLVEPTPTIAPVIVCVVDTGTLSSVAPNSVTAPETSAQNAPWELSLVSLEPRVLMMRHRRRAGGRVAGAGAAVEGDLAISAPRRPRIVVG